MATKLYLIDIGRPLGIFIGHRGRNDTKLNGSASGWRHAAVRTTQDTIARSDTADTVAGPTAGIEIKVTGGSDPLEWVSPPLAAGVTISGIITFNFWMKESNMSANAGAQCVVERLDNTGAVVSTVANSEKGTELGTAIAVQNWTATPTSTVFNKGDRIRVRVAANDVGTMGSGFVVTLQFNGGAAENDSWVQFTENLTFQETEPSGSTYYLRSTASDIADQGAGVDEKALSTVAGLTVLTIVRNTAAGWTAPLQWTVSAGGNFVEWYTPALQAFTLSGPIRVRTWGLESSTAAEAGMNVEVAVVNGDGTGAQVYGSAGLDENFGSSGEMSVGNNEYLLWVAGQDISVAAGQRIRVRTRVDDSLAALVTGHTATINYDDDVVGGNTRLQFTETITEQTGLSATVGQVSEIDLAQAIAWAPKRRLLGQAAEIDLAQVVSVNPQRRLVGQVAELDLAQAIGRLKVLALGQASELDLAQTIAWAPKRRLLGQATELDLAQPIGKAKTVTVAQASEVDLAQAIAWIKRVTLAQAAEVDLAQAITAVKRVALGQASEVDLAQAIGKAKRLMLGLASELDLAQLISTGGLSVALGQASEVDLAQAIAWAPKRRLLGQASEFDLAQAIGKAKRLAIGQAAEVDLAQLIGVMKLRAVGQVAEVDLAQTILWSPKRRLVVQVVEVDTAGGLVVFVILPAVGYLETWDEALHELRVLDESLHELRVLDQALHDVEVSDGRVSL